MTGPRAWVRLQGWPSNSAKSVRTALGICGLSLFPSPALAAAGMSEATVSVEGPSATVSVEGPSATVASPPPVYRMDISYQVAVGCPSAGQFFTALALKLQSDATPPLPSAVIIEREGDEYQLTVESDEADKTGILQERDADCSYLMQRATTVIAMARVVPVAAVDAFKQATFSPVPPAAASLRPEAVDLGEPAQPPPDSPPLPPAAVPRADDSWMYSLGATAVSTIGVLPDPALGGGVRIGLELGDLAVRLSGYLLAPQTEYISVSVGTPPIPLHLRAYGVEASLCARRGMSSSLDSRVSFELCGSLAGSQIAAETQRLGAAEGVASWGAYGVALGVATALENVELGLHLGVQTRLQESAIRKPPFTDALYRPENLQGWLQLSVSTHVANTLPSKRASPGAQP